MSLKASPPSLLGKTYDRYKQELFAWRELTSLENSKQGIAVALSLPETDETHIREKVFEQLSLDKLKAENGFDKLIEFLDKHLKKDDLADSWERFEEFEDFVRSSNQSVTDFIGEFDSRYNRILKKNMKLPAEILAFKLLKQANISKDERMLVLTGMDYSQKNQLYEQAKQSLKKFKGKDAGMAAGSAAIKLEPAFLAQHEEALAAAGYRRYSSLGGENRRYSYGQNQNARQGSIPGKTDTRPMNPKTSAGQIMTCHSCGSFRHLMSKCPYSWESLKAKEAFVSGSEFAAEGGVLFDEYGNNTFISEAEHQGEENVVMFTGFNKPDVTLLGTESRNCAVLDTACSSSVCGTKWLNCFLGSMSEKDKAKVVSSPGIKVFKFGGGEKLTSLQSMHLPCTLAGKKVTVEIDVVDSDIPLLLSLKALKKAQVKLDLENDQAEIFGRLVSLNFTSSGHYCVPVDEVEVTPVESVCEVKLADLDKVQRIKALDKLHRQFVHPSKQRIIALLKDAAVWRDEFQDDIQEVYNKCTLCKQYAPTPARPVVSLPMASSFNERVAMDLKIWKNKKYILHIVDMFSRMSVSVFVRSKHPSEIVDKVMQHWVAVWGVMKSVMFDNGGEFSNSEMREVASMLGVEICTTPAESPWSNGICERNHQVTDRMLEILVDENPKSDLATLLAWANMAKNSLAMWNGFSSYQLVIGKNPELPNIMTDKVPMLQGTTSSETLLKHLNALHTSRRAFIQCEADEKIRRALRHQIRAVQDTFNPGDRVFYKREGYTKWLGPGKVIFQDGRLVFVRHGGVYVRVSTNRLVKSGLEFSSDNSAYEAKPENKMSTTQESDDGMPLEETLPAVNNVPVPEVEEEQPHVAIPSDLANDLAPDVPIATNSAKPIPKRHDIVKYKVGENDDWKTATILGRAGKASGRYSSHYNVQDNNTGVCGNLNFEELDAWHHCENKSASVSQEEVNAVLVPKCQHGEERCIQAKRDELNKLNHFDVYDEVKDTGQKCVSTTWVLCEKGDTVKARLVARGFEEHEPLQTDSPTVFQSSMRILLTIAAHRNWKIKTTDIKSAFLQGKEIQRIVHVIPPTEAKCAPGFVWRLKKSLYGLNDAARHFYDSVHEHLLSLGLTQSQVDPALFYFKVEGRFLGMIATHIDDFMHCGEETFDSLVMDKLKERFEAGKVQQESFRYIGFDVEQGKDGIRLDQSHYMNGCEEQHITPQRAKDKKSPLSTAEQRQFRSQVGKCNWISRGTRPDIAYDVVELSTKFKEPKLENLLHSNKIVSNVQKDSSFVYIPDLGPIENWQMVVMSDAAFANMEDQYSSCGGHVILLTGKNNNACPIAWQCNKIKRVVKSTLAAELLSLSEAIDHSLYLKHILHEVTGVLLPICAFVDNKSVVDGLHSTKSVSEKRLRIDIAAVRQLLTDGDVKSVQWIPGKAMIANVLTKKGASRYDILELLQTGKLYL